jgi:peptide/nickel transport system permease protein
MALTTPHRLRELSALAPSPLARARRRRRNLPLIVGGVLVAVIFGSAAAAPLLAPADPTAINPADRLRPPGPEHRLGTDRLGRDVLSRILYGGRVAVVVGAVAVAIGAGAGVTVGLLSGYRAGRTDAVLMRLVDGLMAFPALLLAILVVAALGPGHLQTMMAIGIVLIPTFARLARAQTLAVRNQEFVVAARAIGVADITILLRHILPNVGGPLLVQSTVAFSGAVLAEASLSYLGLGTQPPTPSWGGMLQEARDVLFVGPWMAVYPGIAIAAAVLGWNLLGDGLRDLLDPRLRRGPR